ncbi:Zinc transporter ZupT [uncultured archaeon]|nr:Zinc transporter ZupT [uncultured archaeon]
MVLEQIIAATVLVGLISPAGILLFFALKKERVDAFMFALVSFSTGTLLGAAFFDLLPESLSSVSASSALALAFFGVITAFAMEKIIHWHHHHHADHAGEHKHPLGMLTLAGDAFHNIFDGIALAAAFMVSAPLGIATTIAVICHEIPHEIGNFSLMLYSGYSRRDALLFNFGTALTAIAGAIAFFFFSSQIANLQSYALAFAAGTFIYIASADIFPELHKETKLKNSIAQLLLILIGAAIIWGVAAFIE